MFGRDGPLWLIRACRFGSGWTIVAWSAIPACENAAVSFRRGTAILALLFALGAAAPSWAQSPASPAAPPTADTPDPHTAMPERPSVATHAGTVAPGWVEVEAGLESDSYTNASRGSAIPVAYKFGLARCLQLTIQTPFVQPSGETVGFGDLSIGVKWRLVDHAPLVGDFAILPSVKFPSGSASQGTGTGTTDASLLFISSQQFGPVSMDVNVGFLHRSGDGSEAPRDASLWAVSFGGPARWRIGWGAEIYGYPATSGPAGADAIVAILVGPTFQVRNWLVLDAGIIAPLTGPQPHAIYSGVTYNIGSLKR
jgi:Putative MetA-pathway of phenol degradation